MTNDDCLTMYNGLKAVKQPPFAVVKDLDNKDEYLFHVKFIKTVSANKKKLEPIIETLREAEKLSDEYKEYIEKRDELLAEYAKKDDDGNPEERVSMIGGVERRAYNVPALHDKKSEVSKKIKKLEDTNKEVIEARKKVEKDMKEMLKEEADFTPILVRESMIPRGLAPEMMDGVMYMIEDEEEAPPEKSKPKK